MNDLPEDITQRVLADFECPIEQEKVLNSLVELQQLNVGRNQLRRAIVFLARGDYEKFMELRKSFLGDPRDLLCEANRSSGDPDYWFSVPFDRMKRAKSEKT